MTSFFKDARFVSLYIHIFYRIGHQSGNMLSIQNKLTLQKELQHFVTNKCVFDRKLKTQQQN